MLFDHLVGAGQQRRRYDQAQRFRRPDIDDQLKFLCCLNRQVGRLDPAKNAIHIICGLQDRIAAVDAIGYKRACVGMSLECKYRGHQMRARPLNNEIALPLGDRVRQGDDAPATSVRCEIGDCAFHLVAVVNAASGHLHLGRPRCRPLDCGKNSLWAVVSGCIRTNTRVVAGAASLRTSSHLPPIEASKLVKPVILPPGRARFSMKPLPAGSATIPNTMGKLPLTGFRMATAGLLIATITSGCMATNSSACCRMFAVSPSHARASNRTFRPSIQPSPASRAL